jgi:hypothetical protein
MSDLLEGCPKTGSDGAAGVKQYSINKTLKTK